MPSICTACKALGLRPKASRMVGATCAVCTDVQMAVAWKAGLDNSIMTSVSSWLKPPCSASFLVLPE